jgi:hypothetical protein
MPHIPDDQAVEVAVVLHQEVLDELAMWTRSAFGEDCEGFLQLFANALVADQALREQIGGMYFGGA